MPSLVEVGSVVLEKKEIFKFVNVFSQFRNYLPLEKGRTLHLNKLASSTPKDDLFFGLVDSEEEDFLKFCQGIFTIS